MQDIQLTLRVEQTTQMGAIAVASQEVARAFRDCTIVDAKTNNDKTIGDRNVTLYVEAPDHINAMNFRHLPNHVESEVVGG